MQPPSAWVADEAQYQDHSLYPEGADIVRLQPVMEPRGQNVETPLVRLEPAEAWTQPEELEVAPPAVEAWQLVPLNLTVPTLIRVFVGGTDDRMDYCLKIVCSQCCAAQIVPTYARVSTDDEMQWDREARGNEVWPYNGYEVDRLLVDQNDDQQDQIPAHREGSPALREGSPALREGSPALREGSRFTYLNPNAPEFYKPCPQVELEEEVEQANPNPRKRLNPEAAPFIGPVAPRVETGKKRPEVNVQYTQDLHVQNGRPNEKRPKNRKYRQNKRPRNRFSRATNSQAASFRGYNSFQPFHQPQNQQVIPEDAQLAQMFQNTTIQMIDRFGLPYGISPMPPVFCGAPEGAPLHCMSASTGHLLSGIGRCDHRW